MKLSVVVATSPGREAQLDACLEMLRRQTRSDFEVLVIDDGSDWGDKIVARYAGLLELRYEWRPNDGSPARSRNAGARRARHAGLVFLDGDMLPNPLALESYARCLGDAPEAAVFGYTGNLSAHLSPSLWFPQIEVMAYDARFCFRSATELAYQVDLTDMPQLSAWSGSFALRAELFATSGGFDETITGWGYEDTEYTNRLVQQGVRLDFCLDAWSEHQVHTQSWRAAAPAKNFARVGLLRKTTQPPRIIYHPRWSRLGELMATYYVPRMREKPWGWKEGE